MFHYNQGRRFDFVGDMKAAPTHFCFYGCLLTTISCQVQHLFMVANILITHKESFYASMLHNYSFDYVKLQHYHLALYTS